MCLLVLYSSACSSTDEPIHAELTNASHGTAGIPPTLIEAVSYGHPWSKKVVHASNTLQRVDAYLNEWSHSWPQRDRADRGRDFCQALDNVRKTYLGKGDSEHDRKENNPMWIEPFGTVYFATERVRDLAIPERKPLTIGMIKQRKMRSIQWHDHRVIHKIFDSLNLRNFPPKLIHDLEEPGAYLFFPPGYEERSGPGLIPISELDYPQVCEFISNSINDLLYSGRVSEEKAIDGLGQMAFVWSHFMKHRATNWGPAFFIQSAIRDRLGMPKRFSWGLDYVMFATLTTQDAIEYYRVWSRSDEYHNKLFEYFSDPNNADDRKLFLVKTDKDCE